MSEDSYLIIALLMGIIIGFLIGLVIGVPTKLENECIIHSGKMYCVKE